ncbi:hypothetical protein HYH02_007841 [Chlamydomonas schloesseri]|uniref:BTB domain-containing protein n=1 Tax=Chlamydomonas schloesseri TaxID=2026947 RepID=A0A835WGP2_9CHLO|nr:hypothetical protein HYH02_007841 [Chlamydomonas schloesseri]|eukprot:KAG2447092.1 hypothetical protein HYH02_007841 [Chlamydomonas schloesseri]
MPLQVRNIPASLVPASVLAERRDKGSSGAEVVAYCTDHTVATFDDEAARAGAAKQRVAAVLPPDLGDMPPPEVATFEPASGTVLLYSRARRCLLQLDVDGSVTVISPHPTFSGLPDQAIISALAADGRGAVFAADSATPGGCIYRITLLQQPCGALGDAAGAGTAKGKDTAAMPPPQQQQHIHHQHQEQQRASAEPVPGSSAPAGAVWTALAYDAQGDVLYAATPTQVHCMVMTGGSSSGSSFSMLNSSSYADIRSLLVLPAMGGSLLVADRSRLVRIDAWSNTAVELYRDATYAAGTTRFTSLVHLPAEGADGGGGVLAVFHAADGQSAPTAFRGPELNSSGGGAAAAATGTGGGSSRAAGAKALSALLRAPAAAAMRAVQNGSGGGSSPDNQCEGVKGAADKSGGDHGRGGGGSSGGRIGSGDAPGMVTVRLLRIDPNNTNPALPAAASSATFLAHRAVLEAHSDYFKQLLGSGLWQDAAAQQEVVLAEVAEPDVFGTLLTFMYTGVLGELAAAQLRPATELAGRLLMPGAAAQLRPRLLASVSPFSAVADLNWAWRHSLTEVADAVRERMERHAARVAAVTPPVQVAALAAAHPELMASLFLAVSRRVTSA